MNIDQVNTVLTKAISRFQEAEIEAMSEAAYTPPSPSALARKAKNGTTQKAKKSKGALKTDSKCMKSYRNSKGSFKSFADCVAAFKSCSGASDPEGVCASMMIHRKQKKSKREEE